MKKQISITLDAEVLDKIKKMAEYEGFSLSMYVNLLLKQHIWRAERLAQEERNY